MFQPISITAKASISALGSFPNEIWSSYLTENHCINKKKFNDFFAFVAHISTENLKEVEVLKKSDAKYKNLDNTVLYAILVAREAVKAAGWETNSNFGVNFGSSRGATTLFEKYHKEFLDTSTSSTLSSPTTTLGNISSWVAHDLQTSGPDISHSITCSTALHSLLNGVAWIQAGLSDSFLVGGSEAALTPFTIAQMQALKVYASSQKPVAYPCRALDLEKQQNTMVLGEGAAVICLEKGLQKNALATIEGIGYATEVLQHNTSISAEAICFQKSMKMALGSLKSSEVDLIVMHAPGTIKGDLTEYKAIRKVFQNRLPFLTTNKWKLGHTFGASGMLSLEFALFMIQHQKAIPVPFIHEQTAPKKIQKVMVNAVGFGGNAVSILISK